MNKRHNVKHVPLMWGFRFEINYDIWAIFFAFHRSERAALFIIGPYAIVWEKK